MSRIWIFFNQKKALSYLILIAIILFGINATIKIQKESAPEVQVPIAVITSALPGATPENVETLIVNEIENAVSSIDNIDKITSTSLSGVGTVVVEFDASSDLKKSINDVKDKIDNIRDNLPDDATDPIVSEVNFSDQPILIASIVSDLPITKFKQEADKLVDKIESISGVSKAELTGVRKEEVTVVVRKKNLIKYSLSLSDIERAIQSNNITMPIGSIKVGSVEYGVNLESGIDNPSEVASIPIQTRDGHTISLSDIAFVSDGVEDYKTISRVSVEGATPTQAATLLVYKQSGADITTTSKKISELITKINNTENTQAKIVKTYDAGEQIIDDLNKLIRTGITTIILVFLVLLIALGFTEALIASLSIPLSFLAAIIVMNASGNTINFISLFSLILAIGILVDTAIVITEAIHTNIKKYADSSTSIKKSIQEFHYPITTGNLTTIAVFFPLFTISGITGEFISSIPFTVIAVLVSSLIISLAFIPLIASTFIKNKKGATDNTQKEKYANIFRNWYKKNIPWILDSKKRKRIFVAGLLISFVTLISFPFFGVIDVSFFPQSDVDYLYINIKEPQGTPLTKTNLSIQTVEDVLMDMPEIKSFTTVVGANSVFDQNPKNGHRFGSVTVNLKKDRKQTSQKILEDISNKLSTYNNLDAEVLEPNDGPPSGAPVLITFFGDNLNELKEIANKASGILKSIDGTRLVTSSGEDEAIEFKLHIDRAKTAEFGISPALVASTLHTAILGSTATTIKKDSDEIDVVVKLDLNPDWNNVYDTNNTTLDAIHELPINTPRGTILLGTILNTSLGISSEKIKHEDESRISTVSSQVKTGFVARNITKEFKKKFADEVQLPEGIAMKIGGETEDVNQSFQDMLVALVMGVVLVLAVLVIQFNSFKQAFIIISTIPLSLIGVLLGLVLTNEYLSFPTMLGFIALAGIVVNNAIILIDTWNRLRKENPETPLRNVVIEGTSLRLRPIFLTTVTTVVGIAPLIFASDMWRPIAIAIIFGLSFAVVLTLILIPILYLKFCNYKN